MHITATPAPVGSLILRLHPDGIDEQSGRGPWTASAWLCPMSAGVAEIRAANNLGDRRVPWIQALPLLIDLCRSLGYKELRCESARLWPGFTWADDLGAGWQRVYINGST
jgi:hypothetical protein